MQIDQEAEMEEKKSGEWMVGLSFCVFLPMMVNLIVMFGVMFGG